VKTPFRALGGSRLGVFRWTAGIVKLLLPPRQSRGISYFCLDIATAEGVSRNAVYERIRGSSKRHGGMAAKNPYVAIWWRLRQEKEARA